MAQVTPIGSGQSGANSTSTSHSLDTVGANVAWAWVIAWSNNGPPTIDTPTLDSVNGTQVGSTQINGKFAIALFEWSGGNLNSGSSLTVSGSISGSTQFGNIHIRSRSASDWASFGSLVVNSDLSTSPSLLNVTSAADDLVSDAIGGNPTGISLAVGGTGAENTIVGSVIQTGTGSRGMDSGGSGADVADGTATMGWTLSGVTVGLHVAVNLVAAGDTNRAARISAFELEVPDAPRRVRVSAFELEVPDAVVDRAVRISAFELEVPTAPRRARVSAFEFEAPDAPRRVRVSAFELEVPTSPRRVRVSAFELEVPTAPRRVRVSAFEFETVDAPRQVRVSAFELQAPDVGGPEQILLSQIGIGIHISIGDF